LGFLFSTFSGISRQGDLKKAVKIGPQKVHAENVLQKNRPKIRCQFFLDFLVLCFIAVSGVSQRRELKSTTKTFCKQILSKSA
jgi:hypothetical protein